MKTPKEQNLKAKNAELLKEVEIEAALEQVRSRAMAMQNSNELHSVAKVLLDKLNDFEIGAGGEITIAIVRYDDLKKDLHFWIASPEFPTTVNTLVPYNGHPIISDFWKARQRGDSYFAKIYGAADSRSWWKWALVHTSNRDLPESRKKQLLESDSFSYAQAIEKYSGIYIQLDQGQLPTEKERKMLQRFAKVFDQTYIRFKDLEQAEEQAREAQIQLALERVRARTMAMQKSDELPETSSLLFQQVKELGEEAIQNSIAIVNEEAGFVELSTTVHGSHLLHTLNVPINDPYVMAKAVAAWKAKRKSLTLEFKGQELKDYNELRNSFLETKINFPEDIWVVNISFFSKGWLSFSFNKNVSDDIIAAQKRFAAVFDQTYTRFKDLEQAEEQARESQIQLGLEHVRAKAMAMQTSEELNELIGTVFGELTKLDFVLTRCLIMIFDPETKASRWWMANSELPAEPMNYLVQNHKNPAYYAYLKAWEERDLRWNYALKGKVKRDWDDFLFADTELARLPAPVITGMKAPEQVLLSASFNNFGCLTLVTLEPLSDEHSDIMLRFAKVFDMCYTRFNDLKQAEEQARESQIQLALERVRARTMAMQKSGELHEVIQLVFDQLQQLNFNIDVANFALNYKETDDFDLMLAVPHGKYPMEIHVPYFKHPVFDRFNKAKRKGNLLADTLTKDQKDSFFEHFFKYVPGVSEETKASIFGRPGFVRSAVLMRITALTIHNYDGIPYSEAENNTLLRFGQVFEQTHTRFKDLEQAEEQTREAKIEASLERVRSHTIAMQHSDELKNVIQVIYEQLHQLNFNIDSADFNLDYRDTDDFNLWVGVPGRPYPAKMHVPYIDHPLFNRIVKAKVKVPAVIADCYTSDQKNTYFKHNFKFSPTPIPAERQNFILSGEGLAISTVLMANVALSTMNYSGVPYTDADNATLMRFGKVFEQTYTRFNDLKQAEEQAREAQIQLGLERVRARAMAMQSSDELAEMVGIVFKELTRLDFGLTHCALAIADADSVGLTLWQANSEADQPPISFYRKSFDHPYPNATYKEWKKRTAKWVYHLKGAEKKAMHDYYAKSQETMNVPNAVKEGMAAFDSIILSHSFDNFGYLRTDTKEPLSENNLDIVCRFAKAFDLCYTRFTDIKQAEAQAKESQIQLALERVRARTMAMQRSEELAETATVLFQQLYSLDVTPERVFIGIPDDQNRTIELWGTEQGGTGMSTRFEAHADGAYSMSQIFEGWEDKKTDMTVFLSGEHLDEHINYVANIMHMPVRMELVQDHRILYCTYFSKGMFVVVTSDVQSEKTLNVLRRFAAVFDQTYTRFLDLQKAEAQARESQIQLGLERVRAAAMAMHDSNDVGNATALVFNELYKLGITTIRCGVCIIDGTMQQMEVWSATSSQEGKVNRGAGRLDMTAHPLWIKLWNAWKKKQSSFTYELKGKELADYYKAITNASGYHAPDSNAVYMALDDAGKRRQFCNCFLFNEGCVFAFTQMPFSTETSQVLEKFTAVFGLTYRRYLDLTRAEAQAREAQIEASLERVRSKTMAMHNSADVGETVTLMFNELVKLGVDKIARCGIAIIPDNDGLIELWTAKLGRDEKEEIIIGHIDKAIHPMLALLYDAWKSKQAHFEYLLEGDDLTNYITALNNYRAYPIKYEIGAWGQKQYHNDFFFHEGMVFAFTFQPLSAEIAAIFKRFAGVFGQTYRRYLDLQKAEAAAREAQIEAALERVRGKAMAMRSSGDVNATANTVFIELRKLDVDLVRCGLGLMEKETRISTIHAATNSDEGGSLEVLGNIDMNTHPVLEGIYSHWRQNEDYFPVLEEESLKSYYEKLRESGLSVPEWKSGEKQYGYFLQFTYGALYVWSGKQESELTIKTLKRFTSVISLTYTRYIELQKAELNTKEAVKQASLDRVRAEIASMRKRSDLERITPLIWDELTILGIPFIRCGVFIMDEEQKLIHTFLSTPDGKAIGAFHIPFDTSGNFEIMVDSWRNKMPYIDHWKEEAFSQFADTLVKQGAISSKAQYLRTLPHEGVHLNFLPFLQGMLYVGNIEPLTEDNINLIQAVAGAFSTAYARYEDFNKLEAAKRQVDNTLTDLKATQTRLIQSEKMASLGELTAGIAHEIQNPLNFVNNFSEVNQEMIDELEDELKSGNIDEALAIAAEIKTNEQKINHHGRRADGIVKGMLQHSRTGGGEKQPTNMNTIADEFMRLAYHGLRAKDKLFNAEMATHFDPDLPQINVIAQDMGRVMLNLFNNAFYAVNEKKKTMDTDYDPQVTVTTAVEKGNVIISVKDNGIGMTEHIKDKIMQPFFTTKPTGEGTGLGLSLTYDMVVKGHGGSIQVNSKEGEGSEFIISLPLS